jgi:hypothetical protein
MFTIPQPGYQRANPGWETTDWRAVFGRIARRSLNLVIVYSKAPSSVGLRRFIGRNIFDGMDRLKALIHEGLRHFVIHKSPPFFHELSY